MKNLIPVNEFCTHHNIGISFIHSLQETGLIEIKTVEESVYIHKSRLPELERIVRLYFELDINLEGIETINYLLKQIFIMQDEITMLRNRLRLYESTD
ncbi:MAG: MerR family transcriptional regulator [Bacteroidetes bacterium]|nr:MerR family transcriptional regulator [Bacteroidota bacterium]